MPGMVEEMTDVLGEGAGRGEVFGLVGVATGAIGQIEDSFDSLAGRHGNTEECLLPDDAEQRRPAFGNRPGDAFPDGDLDFFQDVRADADRGRRDQWSTGVRTQKEARPTRLKHFGAHDEGRANEVADAITRSHRRRFA